MTTNPYAKSGVDTEAGDKAVELMKAPKWDNSTLEDLNQVMTDASICGLGQAAPNPIRCVQKYFPQEIN